MFPIWFLSMVPINTIFCVLVLCLCAWSLSYVWLQPHGLVARQASLSTEFSRQEYWSWLPFPTPGDLPDPGIKPTSPALADRFLTTEPPRKSSEPCPKLKETASPKFTRLPRGQFHSITVTYKDGKTSFVIAKQTRRKNKRLPINIEGHYIRGHYCF